MNLHFFMSYIYIYVYIYIYIYIFYFYLFYSSIIWGELYHMACANSQTYFSEGSYSSFQPQTLEYMVV